MVSRRHLLNPVYGLLLFFGLLPPTACASFPNDTRQLIHKFCADCHSGSEPEGGVDFEQLMLDGELAAGYRKWLTGVRMLNERHMPPENAPQPSISDRRALAEGIQTALRDAARSQATDPGQVLMRRLTDAEHRYTLEDLTGLELDLPDIAADAVGGEGFTNVGGVQFVQDATLERYLEAAKIVASHAVVGAGELQFFRDPGQTGVELSAIDRIQAIYRQHGFRTAAGEGGEPFGLDLYPRSFYVSWQYHHRQQIGNPDATIQSLAEAEGISPRFAAHIWSILSSPTATFPTSLIVDEWATLPEPSGFPAQDTTEVRRNCESLYQSLREWQVHLAGADDEEVARVLTERTLVVRSAESLKARIVWPEGEQIAKLTIAVKAIDGGDASGAAVVWYNPQIRFQDFELRWLPWRPFHEALNSDAIKVLGLNARAGTGEPAFAVEAGQTKSIEITLPENGRSAELTVEARIATQGAGRVVRCDISAGLLASLGRGVSALLADTASQAYLDWKYGALQFAANMPQVSQREPAPSDRDPIPGPFDNTYNMPERDYFHYKVKYFREDQFLVDFILDDVVQHQLDAAWADLLTSFEYHDVFLKFVYDKYDLSSNFKIAAELDRDAIDQLPAEASEHVRRLFEEHGVSYQLLDRGRARHHGDVLQFAERAWRRPLSALEADQLTEFYEQVRSELGLEHVSAVQAAIVRILVSPQFLYRAERAEHKTEARPLSDWEIASRLSFFIWSSSPDEELRRAAAAGELSDPTQVAAQAKRMLGHPRARRLAREFFGQWFGFYQFDRYRGVDPTKFPEFNEPLKQAMYDEAVSFFDYIIREDRPVREILFADYAFLNEVLAEHYGVEIPLADRSLRRVDDVRASHRGGLFGLGAVLTMTSAPLRTSPVKRGDWVLRRVVGTPVPPPPADAGSISADDASSDGLTGRELLEAHRQRASCMNCHSRIDPLGFALEHYDALGRWRTEYRGGQSIDASGTLSDGTQISGPEGLRDYLAANEESFHRTLCRKLLGYALGRREALADIFLVEQMMEEVQQQGRLSSLVKRIVVSDQFRYHRGIDDE